MGVIKRILRRTSHKLMAKLGAQRRAQRLVLNHPVKSRSSAVASCADLINLNHQLTTSSKSRRSNQNLSSKGICQQGANKVKRTKKQSKLQHELTDRIPEALLLAAKNYLPPVQFHHIHGPNAQLSKNKFVARRTQSFCQALVFSNRVILPNERVYIKVLEIAKGWSGTIRFGFTSVDPATLRYQMPKHACPDMTNEGHTWARALADEVVRRNSVIHFSYNTNGYIHYGINNQDCGIFHANVSTSQHLWFIVDIYGLTAAVELIDPRIHAASSELDISRLDDEFGIGGHNANGDTMYKSTGAMNELTNFNMFLPSGGSRNKKKRSSRKSAARHAALLAAANSAHWSPDASHLLMASQLPNGGLYGSHQQPAAGNLLPNLSSVMLPAAQQNIYSPMPGVALNNSSTRNEPHDYYQIMTNRAPQMTAANDSYISHPQQAATRGQRSTSVGRRSRTAAAAAVMAHGDSALNSSLTATSAVGDQRRSSAARHRDTGDCATNEVAEISQQLASFQFTDTSGQQQQQHISSPSDNKSSAPVAAARRKLPPQSSNNSTSVQTNNRHRTATDNTSTKAQASNNNFYQNSPPTTKTSKSSAVVSSSSAPKPRASRQQQSSSAGSTVKAQKVAANQSRDNNNNSPTSKDCPICFERPINCVLYQCGHMCTCYECGVKQWRTQSRTCPICRTIIKDVIKTYMS